MRIIDGSRGEGGGQILRTALSLAAVTGQPFRLEQIRAGREKPGLLRQHLACVEAMRAICNARVTGGELRSMTLEFVPAAIRAGDYSFAVGSAGSANLVLQTVLPPLLCASGSSRVSVEGGTHNPWAPTTDFLIHTFLPLVNRLGPRVSLTEERPGFYPAGGGRVVLSVTPLPLVAFDLVERGPIRSRRAVALISHLSPSIGHRELQAAQEAFGLDQTALEVREVKAAGPGNAFWIELVTAEVTEIFTAFGEKSRSAKQVATDAIDEAREWIASETPVGPHLADQWVLLLAIAGGGRFRTGRPTEHLRTNIKVIEQFLEVHIRIEPLSDVAFEVVVSSL